MYLFCHAVPLLEALWAGDCFMFVWYGIGGIPAHTLFLCSASDVRGRAGQSCLTVSSSYRQLFTIFIFICGLTWDVLKTWAVLHGVLFHPRHCSNWAASGGAMSGVANICPVWLLASFIFREKFLCTVVGGCFFHRLDRVCTLSIALKTRRDN